MHGNRELAARQRAAGAVLARHAAVEFVVVTLCLCEYAAEVPSGCGTLVVAALGNIETKYSSVYCLHSGK